MNRPSSLPMLAQCPCFESSGTDFAEMGNDRHSALKLHFHGDDSELDLLDDDSQAAIRWAADYIRANTTESYFIEWETKRSWTRPDFSEAEGTVDVANGPDLFDFKWRYRDYSAQMADYASERLERGFKVVTVHLLFGADRRVEKLRFDAEACEKVLQPILDSLKDPKPRPCDYCGWCAKRLVCPALTGPAATIAAGYAEPGLLDIKDWHPSAMLDKPEELAFALMIARKVLKKWIESVEFHAMEAAIKRGLKLPGFELKPKRGRQFIADVQKAYEVSGLEPHEFLQACDVRLNSSPRYPDKRGLDSIFKVKFGEASAAAAKRSVQKKLDGVILRRADTYELRSVKDGEQEETE
jgi:hypothetical protein